jgi:two-component sensor histidine kinase
MTLRSLTMAAFIIKKQGLFNLKIAGQVPGFTNQFRIGVVKSEPRLRDLLNRAIATLTPQDVQTAVNHHIAVQVQTKVDYTWALGTGGATLVLVVLGLLSIGQLRRLNAALAQREAEKALILREVHHRIKNNLSTIQGLLYLQAESMPDSAASAALADAQHRVQSMMLLYDRIYRTESYGAVSARHYVTDLVDRVLENFPAPPVVTVEKDLADLALSADQLQPLGMILNELLTNVMKYAFRGRDKGRIWVAVTAVGPRVELVLEDDGPGLPATVDFQNSTGFGLQLVGMLARQLGGSIRVDRERGARVVLEFPAARA